MMPYIFRHLSHHGEKTESENKPKLNHFAVFQPKKKTTTVLIGLNSNFIFGFITLYSRLITQ